MTKSPMPVIRGRRCGLLSRDRRAISTLERQLALLGLTIAVAPETIGEPVDVCFIDIDTTLDDQGTGFVAPKAPVIALVGTETPGRLEWVLSLEPSAILMKPLASHGIYTALVVAFHDARRRDRDFQRVVKLEERVRSRRIVVGATIRLMRHYGIDEAEAYALLRNAAQQRRATIESVSAEVADNVFLPVRLITSR